jgi:hypothetical protein
VTYQTDENQKVHLGKYARGEIGYFIWGGYEKREGKKRIKCEGKRERQIIKWQLKLKAVLRIQTLLIRVRYHCGGWPEEVNTCFLNSYMVYL